MPNKTTKERKSTDYLIPFSSYVHMRCSCEPMYLCVSRLKEKFDRQIDK